MEAILAWAAANQWIYLVIAFLAGGSSAFPVLKKFVASTPNKVDDIVLNAIENAVTSKAKQVSTAAELEKRIPTSVLIEIVKIRKERMKGIVK
jgi:hypothetical protein